MSLVDDKKTSCILNKRILLDICIVNIFSVFYTFLQVSLRNRMLLIFMKYHQKVFAHAKTGQKVVTYCFLEALYRCNFYMRGHHKKHLFSFVSLLLDLK